ncbi:unnamed protein product [Calypogeia fissa]
MTLSTEEALTFLKQSSTTTGDTVFTHLSELLRHVLASKPNNAVDILETSFLLKSTRYLSTEGDKPLREGRDPKDVDAIVAFLELFSTKELPPEEGKPPEKKEKKVDEDAETEDGSEAAETETEGGEEEEPQNEFEAENLVGDSTFLEAAGVGLGSAETYMIMLALKKLGDDPKLGVSTVRFFGKFFGTQSNYYVFESIVKDVEGEGEEESTPEGEEAKEKEPVEPKFFWQSFKDKIPLEEKVGTNLNVYWVCNKLGEKCRRLPDVTPLQIRMAKSLKKYFTGKLDAEVSAYPPFPGLEENFLRAQIARISAATQLAPNGYFSGGGGDEEGGGDMAKSEEWTRPPDEELATLESWVHKGLYIRKEGRCTEFELPEGEEGEETQEEEEEEPPEEEGTEEGEEGEEGEENEGDEEEAKPKEEEPEEIPEALRSVDQDKELSEGLKPWSISLSSSMKSFKNQVISLRSLNWPGAYTVATSTGFCNIYVGWGVKNSIQAPPLPPKLMKEYSKKELQESVELPPQPKKEQEDGTEGDTESQAETEATEEEE